MRVLIYSTKNFELDYIRNASGVQFQTVYVPESLSLKTVQLAEGFECISVFTVDDVSEPIIKRLASIGVKYIAVRAAGYDNVDIPSAEKHGIRVANVPKYSPYSVAEHAVAMLLAMNRKLILANAQVQKNDFTVDNLVGFDVHGKTVGIIGTGCIGTAMARIMHGFGCKLLAHDIEKNRSLQEQCDVTYVSLETLCMNSDIISLHVPLNDSTMHMINSTLIGKMKQDVMIINTCRGAVVNTVDMIKAIEDGIVAYYGMDVYEREKGIFFNDLSGTKLHDDQLLKLMSMKNVLITPHQAFATREALTSIASTTFESICCWKRGERSPNELTHKSKLKVPLIF